jgi:sugar phosphate isomerase/epimerase
MEGRVMELRQVTLAVLAGGRGERIKTIHVRQSRGGVWTEVLGEGDIDYGVLARMLRGVGFDGVVVMEQCVEEGTVVTMGMAERLRVGREWVERVFSGGGGGGR